MKIWPELNENGDLPAGIHAASLDDVLQRFGSGPAQRLRVGRRLRDIYNLAISTGYLGRFIIFGSFITSKPDPNDVDIFMLMEDGFNVSRVSHEAKLIFDHVAAQNYLGASIFWIRRVAAIGGEATTISH